MTRTPADRSLLLRPSDRPILRLLAVLGSVAAFYPNTWSAAILVYFLPGLIVAQALSRTSLIPTVTIGHCLALSFVVSPLFRWVASALALPDWVQILIVGAASWMSCFQHVRVKADRTHWVALFAALTPAALLAFCYIPIVLRWDAGNGIYDLPKHYMATLSTTLDPTALAPISALAPAAKMHYYFNFYRLCSMFSEFAGPDRGWEIPVGILIQSVTLGYLLFWSLLSLLQQVARRISSFTAIVAGAIGVDSGWDVIWALTNHIRIPSDNVDAWIRESLQIPGVTTTTVHLNPFAKLLWQPQHVLGTVMALLYAYSCCLAATSPRAMVALGLLKIGVFFSLAESSGLVFFSLAPPLLLFEVVWILRLMDVAGRDRLLRLWHIPVAVAATVPVLLDYSLVSTPLMARTVSLKNIGLPEVMRPFVEFGGLAFVFVFCLLYLLVRLVRRTPSDGGSSHPIAPLALFVSAWCLLILCTVSSMPLGLNDIGIQANFGAYIFLALWVLIKINAMRPPKLAQVALLLPFLPGILSTGTEVALHSTHFQRWPLVSNSMIEFAAAVPQYVPRQAAVAFAEAEYQELNRYSPVFMGRRTFWPQHDAYGYLSPPQAVEAKARLAAIVSADTFPKRAMAWREAGVEYLILFNALPNRSTLEGSARLVHADRSWSLYKLGN